MKKPICEAKVLRKFAKLKGFNIHPAFPPEEWAKDVIEAGHCPCSEIRPRCPCKQCVEEVKKDGHCKCCFFVSDDYLVEHGYRKKKKMKK